MKHEPMSIQKRLELLTRALQWDLKELALGPAQAWK